jgi:two-component system chemotaxis response regulator CheB
MRVFIADDSILIRNVVREVLGADPSVVIAGEAANGADAVRKVLELSPDVVMMDVDMPIMNGLEATAKIAERSKVPIMVFTHNSDPELPFKALSLGAVDFMLKPDFSDLNKPEYVEGLVARLRSIAKGEVGARVHGAIVDAAGDPAPHAYVEALATRHDGKRPARMPRAGIVVIGASTGGPHAVATLLSGLPKPFKLPVALVQHIETGFDRGYVEWLRDETGHDVRLARPGDRPEAGVVHVGPTDYHLAFSAGAFALDDGEKVLNQKPSVDVLFRSAAAHWGSLALGVLLTGMGADGAEGCRAIREAGGWTIAQDEATSLIFGMPRAAIERGAASAVLPLGGIAGFLAEVAGHGR